MRKIKHNDLLPWFLEDHGQLPDAYKRSCQKFFDKIKATSSKQQASSKKRFDKDPVIGYYRTY